jgi:hypothetical protein
VAKSIGITSLVVCLAATATVFAARSIPFRSVADGSGASSAVTKRTQIVVRDRVAWRSLWRRLNSRLSPRPALPKVDFSRFMLVAVTYGQRPSGGYTVRVTGISDDGRRLRVRIVERAPGADCITPAVITAPYHVVRVRRSSKQLVFARTRTVYTC